MKNKIKILLIIFTLGFLASGCDLNVSNPNSPTNEDLKTYDGMRMTAIGMQARLSQSIGDFNTVSGAVSGETSPIIAYIGYQSLRRYPDASKRSLLEKSNEYMVTVWSVQFQIVKSANDILNNIEAIGMDAQMKKNIKALAEVGKVMAFYNLITHWEKIPIDINKDHPSYVDRPAVIAECLNLLNDAEANISGGLAKDFTGKIIGANWDLANTIQAYKARFMLMKGDYANAIDAASKVSVESQYVYAEGTGTNPLWVNYTTSKFSAALSRWVEGAETGDKRIAATVDLTTKRSDYFGKDTAYIIIKYNAATKPYKIYTLNEMTLIKAEALARSGNNSSALTEVNKIRTAAGLKDYTGTNVLREVFVQRFYECYLMAQHFEDLRRFKSDNIDIVKYQRDTQLAHEWLIYPYTEIDINPNCPAQPLNINLGM
ncbi:MAG: RagB/SusD family nutrient uptake outer membrane protein [Bacillota bacterium]